MDALSDVLKAVRLEGAVYLDAEFTAPWCFLGKHGRTSIRERLAGAEHVVYFHFLTEDACKVGLADGGAVLDVAAGDLVLLPQEDRHLMGSDLHLAPLEGESLVKAAVSAGGDPEFLPVRHRGGGVVTRFVCGYLACSRSMCRPLLEGAAPLRREPAAEGAGAGWQACATRTSVARWPSCTASRAGRGPWMSWRVRWRFPVQRWPSAAVTSPKPLSAGPSNASSACRLPPGARPGRDRTLRAAWSQALRRAISATASPHIASIGRRAREWPACQVFPWDRGEVLPTG